MPVISQIWHAQIERFLACLCCCQNTLQCITWKYRARLHDNHFFALLANFFIACCFLSGIFRVINVTGENKKDIVYLVSLELLM